MTLNKLIEKTIELSRRYTSGDIPLYINGREVDIELKDVGENGDYRIIMVVTNKPEPLPEMRIIDEIEVIVSNWARLNDLLSQGILKQITVECGFDTTVFFTDNHTEAHTYDWLVQDEQKRWWVMNSQYHKNMVKQGKLIKV